MVHAPTAAVSTVTAHRCACAVSDSSPIGGDSTGTDPSDDALALALETELPVSIPPGTWLFNATHPLLADGQTVLGVGSQTIIKPSGNFNFLTISGGLIGCEIGNFHYDGALQSGGYIVYASNHGRTIIRNIKSTSPFDGFYSEQVNQLTFKDLWLQTQGGNVSIGSVTATARLHLAAGTATASTAPLKLTTGTVNTTAEAGAV